MPNGEGYSRRATSTNPPTRGRARHNHGLGVTVQHVEVRAKLPERFGSLSEARQFMELFTIWYKHEHRHTGYTPTDEHHGLAAKSRRPPRRTDQRPRPKPASLKHDLRAEDPRSAQHRLDQPTSPGHQPRARHDNPQSTPDKIIHREKFRTDDGMVFAEQGAFHPRRCAVRTVASTTRSGADKGIMPAWGDRRWCPRLRQQRDMRLMAQVPYPPPNWMPRLTSLMA